jgi:hypothetical protein
MKLLLRTILVLATVLAAGANAHAESPEQDDKPSYELPAIVHGKTSMRQAMRSGSTFSFKLYQTDEPPPRQPYSYPEPDSNGK